MTEIDVTKSVAAQFRIQVASTKLSLARERRERASIEVDYYALILAIREWENRTGLDHLLLLKGVFKAPYGSEGERSI